MNDVQLLVTGRYFTGAGLRGIEPVMEELIASAHREIQMLIYLLSEGAFPLLLGLQEALSRGVRCTLVVNHMQDHDPTVKTILDSLGARFPNARIVDFSDPKGGQLHAKILVVDRQRAVVGSANFSWGGLFGNHEVGVLLEGAIAWDLASLIDSFLERLP